MSGGERLFHCKDPAVWRGVYDKYWAVVEAKAAGKQKSSGKLLELEKWYQMQLPAAILARTERSLTQSELVKLMEWKLTRGKFRPRLKQLVGSNSEEAVLQCTKKAFCLLPDVQSAIAELSTLKGLGPATASAVLAAGAPGEVAFMADEVVESIAELRPVQYTAKHFSLFLEKIQHKTNQLNEADSQHDWTPHKVELCLWACQIQPSLLKALPLSDNPNRETEEEETRERRSKRRKTE
ncbi:uncharacterized protein zgc:112496 [Tachysurus vachellii]|uniref:uncharacterized protein zgc:112496 n=1 Tax=Tachysurus vachellii TaxID=175792 RepID=UPI00296A9C4A|nr:uncharacterized protein zgc:112496 [Tachysurus vachellii]XP_060727156.1 uncharacterized protein zgc:112496 [Tachysurus vachellii]XP_060727157.1 uncharacterized protein zgc:112496 [Tachysurus vachellii]XP_060727158.1 uncharacterized protein zgc:112496 [Tachysurus vachellii]XP_060727159.1 uncharacterized protein zgc:112496 [Tachysurus vachellii]